MQDLITLHIKNKYYIDVSKKEAGCIVRTPANIFYEPQFLPETTEYTINQKILTINNQDIVVPSYAIRAIIFTDICMKLIKLQMSKDLILFFDKFERKKTFSEIVNAPDNIEDKNKDNYILGNLGNMILGKYDENDAKNNGISAGFNLIRDIFAKGGI